MPARHSPSAAQVSLQVPCASQMFDWHCTGALQAPPALWPHWPPTHWPPAHSRSRVQLVPPGAFGVQAPLTQALVERQSPSALQPVAQLPPLHVSLLHAEAFTQAPPVGVPQVPWVQVADAHSVARVHAAPLGSAGAQVPAWHERPCAQLALLVQPATQTWASHEPLRQASPPRHAPPLGAPQKPSVPHWPARQAASVAHGPPLGTPHTPAISPAAYSSEHHGSSCE